MKERRKMRGKEERIGEDRKLKGGLNVRGIGKRGNECEGRERRNRRIGEERELEKRRKRGRDRRGQKKLKRANEKGEGTGKKKKERGMRESNTEDDIRHRNE